MGFPSTRGYLPEAQTIPRARPRAGWCGEPAARGPNSLPALREGEGDVRPGGWPALHSRSRCGRGLASRARSPGAVPTPTRTSWFSGCVCNFLKIKFNFLKNFFFKLSFFFFPEWVQIPREVEITPRGPPHSHPARPITNISYHELLLMRYFYLKATLCSDFLSVTFKN